MDRRDIQKKLSTSYDRDTWINEIYPSSFKNVKFFESPQLIKSKDDRVQKFFQLGYIIVNDDKRIALYEVEVNVNIKLKKNRVELNDMIANRIGDGTYTAAIALFYQENNENYRLTFCGKNTIFDKELWDFKENRTDTKRFTYYGGKGESNRTLAERFLILQNEQEVSIDDVVNVFNVEKLSKEFFDKYKRQFDKFWIYIDSHQSYKKLFSNEEGKRELRIRDFTKKLLGRIVFLHFLQKKGWMGCSSGQSEWLDGNKQFMQSLFNNYDNKKLFHSKCLSQLFYNSLNKKREGDLFFVEGLSDNLNNIKIPYLNGVSHPPKTRHHQLKTVDNIGFLGCLKTGKPF